MSCKPAVTIFFKFQLPFWVYNQTTMKFKLASACWREQEKSACAVVLYIVLVNGKLPKNAKMNLFSLFWYNNQKTINHITNCIRACWRAQRDMNVFFGMKTDFKKFQKVPLKIDRQLSLLLLSNSPSLSPSKMKHCPHLHWTLLLYYYYF